MSKVTGTVVADALVSAGGNATHYDTNGQGGSMAVRDLDGRDDISVGEALDPDGLSSGRRKVGMTVYVVEEDKEYRLQPVNFLQLDDAGRLDALADNANWVELAAEDTAFVFQVGAVSATHYHTANLSANAVRYLVENTGSTVDISTNEVNGHTHTVTVMYNFSKHTFDVLNITSAADVVHEAFLIGSAGAEGGEELPIVSVSHAELLLLTQTSQLIPESRYRIYDFWAVQGFPAGSQIAVGGVLHSLDDPTTAEQWLNNGSTYEPLIVRAKTRNELYPEATSEVYPSDKIKYQLYGGTSATYQFSPELTVDAADTSAPSIYAFTLPQEQYDRIVSRQNDGYNVRLSIQMEVYGLITFYSDSIAFNPAKQTLVLFTSLGVPVDLSRLAEAQIYLQKELVTPGRILYREDPFITTYANFDWRTEHVYRQLVTVNDPDGYSETLPLLPVGYDGSFVMTGLPANWTPHRDGMILPVMGYNKQPYNVRLGDVYDVLLGYYQSPYNVHIKAGISTTILGCTNLFMEMANFVTVAGLTGGTYHGTLTNVSARQLLFSDLYGQLGGVVFTQPVVNTTMFGSASNTTFTGRIQNAAIYRSYVGMSFGDVVAGDILDTSVYDIDGLDPEAQDKLNLLAKTPTGGFEIGEGNNARTGGNPVRGMAIGLNNTVNQFEGMAIGNGNQSKNVVDYAIGLRNITGGGRNLAIGIDNKTPGGRAIAIGGANEANATYSIAIGEGNKANATRQVVISGTPYNAPADAPNTAFLEQLRMFKPGSVLTFTAPNGTLNTVTFDDAGQMLVNGAAFQGGGGSTGGGGVTQQYVDAADAQLTNYVNSELTGLDERVYALENASGGSSGGNDAMQTPIYSFKAQATNPQPVSNNTYTDVAFNGLDRERGNIPGVNGWLNNGFEYKIPRSGVWEFKGALEAYPNENILKSVVYLMVFVNGQRGQDIFILGTPTNQEYYGASGSVEITCQENDLVKLVTWNSCGGCTLVHGEQYRNFFCGRLLETL